jgi:hypothetical protein
LIDPENPMVAPGDLERRPESAPCHCPAAEPAGHGLVQTQLFGDQDTLFARTLLSPERAGDVG